MEILALAIKGLFLLTLFHIVGTFPPLTVAVTALGIVFMFLVFGKE